MPNHITNHVEIKGSPQKIKKLIKESKIKLNNDLAENEFDFNAVIKLPKVLQESSSPLKIFKTESEAKEYNDERNKEPNSFDKKYEWAISEEENNRRKKEYGANNWYDWSIRHWGTKWNSYEVRYIWHKDDTLVFEFQTAWSQPDGVYQALEDQGFKVNAVYYDEDPSNQGEWGDEPYDAFSIYTYHEVDYVG